MYIWYYNILQEFNTHFVIPDFLHQKISNLFQINIILFRVLFNIVIRQLTMVNSLVFNLYFKFINLYNFY